MDNKRVLVTGGTGFIGSALVKRLVNQGYALVVFDNNYRGSLESLSDVEKNITLIEGDIRDKESVKKAAKDCCSIFHLAFINGTKYFYEQPELVLEVGVKGALNTLEAAIENDVPKYILASSSEVYQQPTQVPTPEGERIIIPDVRNPRYSYSGGKVISELLVINYLRKSPIKHCIFRPHNVFGPRMGFEHVIPELMKKLCDVTENFKKDACSINIQGSGDESRAFCFVEDAVDQIMVIFEKGNTGEIYHVGIDQERTIRQLIEDIGNVLNIKIEIKPGELRQGGTSRRCPNIDKICSLGYEKNNNYYLGLKKTVEWYKKYFIDNKNK